MGLLLTTFLNVVGSVNSISKCAPESLFRKKNCLAAHAERAYPTKMPSRTFYLIGIFLFAVLSAGAGEKASKGFWQKDPSWQRRATLQRKIYISARTDTHEKLQRLRVDAMAIVKAPAHFAAEKAQDYEELPQVSGHFKSAEFRADTQQLFLVTEALRWQARMLMQLRYSEDESGHPVHQFEIIGGSFQGLKGQFTFAEFEGRQTQLVLSASYSDKSLPLPKILMGVALEVVVEQAAQKMRAHIEKSYQSGQKP